MRFLSTFSLVIHMIVLVLIGVALISIAMNTYRIAAITEIISSIYTNNNFRIIIGTTGALLVFISLLTLQFVFGKLQREKTIAFENPDGQVLISLSAIEDFIKRSLKALPEVKELRPNVRASKRGVSITSRVTLYSDANIPEITEHIQNIIKGRVQDLLGIEEPVHIRIHVAKIAQREQQPPKKEAKKDDHPTSFHGIEYGTD